MAAEADTHLGLFENGREANLTSTVAMVEDVLIELGHFLNECRTDDDTAHRAWRVVKGSAAVRITLMDRNDYTHLRVVSAVMTIDTGVDIEALYSHLLSLNATEIHGAAFGLRSKEVLLVAERSTLDLDRSEVLDLIKRVESYADDYDDKLVATFGGLMGGEA